MLFPLLQIPSLMLYAETHFRFFRFFPSFLFRKEPEILFDLPRRIDPGMDLPIMLICNDINAFPIDIKKVSIVISQKGVHPITFTFNDVNCYKVKHPLQEQSSVYLFSIKRTTLKNGHIYVNCKASILNQNHDIEVLNDNLFSSSKMSFTCFLAESKLPGSDICSYGDIHIHSQYSQSHIEFGPPIVVIDKMVESSGLDFYAITDHSYDIACHIANYLKSDSSLTRWNAFLNDSMQPLKKILVRGEEISCKNSQNHSIHLCALNISDYISGCIDGARKDKLETLSLKEAIQQVHLQNGIAIAAHPGSKFGFLQRFLLKRGSWHESDMMQAIDAVQAVNNGFKKSWEISKALWIKELLKGRKIQLVAGNDSHGDFNRYRYISMPFISIAEDFERYLGYTKTGIYGKTATPDDVTSAIKNGRTFVTSGPYLELSANTQLKNQCSIANTIPVGTKAITAIIKSNNEFGFPKKLEIYWGNYSSKKETLFLKRDYKNNEFEINVEIEICNLLEKGYLRAELTCEKYDTTTSFAATSPCYFT